MTDPTEPNLYSSISYASIARGASLPRCLAGTFSFLHQHEDKNRGLKWSYAEKSLLDRIQHPGPGGRFHLAVLVGNGGDHSRRRRELVDRLPQRLVLAAYWEDLLRCYFISRSEIPRTLRSE